jgi:hypothetical protein
MAAFYPYIQPVPFADATVQEVRASGCVCPDVSDDDVAELGFRKYFINDWTKLHAVDPDSAYRLVVDLATQAHKHNASRYATGVLKATNVDCALDTEIVKFIVSRPVNECDVKGLQCFRNCFGVTKHLHSNAWVSAECHAVVSFFGATAGGEKLTWHAIA